MWMLAHKTLTKHICQYHLNRHLRPRTRYSPSSFSNEIISACSSFLSFISNLQYIVCKCIVRLHHMIRQSTRTPFSSVVKWIFEWKAPQRAIIAGQMDVSYSSLLYSCHALLTSNATTWQASGHSINLSLGHAQIQIQLDPTTRPRYFYRLISLIRHPRYYDTFLGHQTFYFKTPSFMRLRQSSNATFGISVWS
jgi:hypothetical protein